MRRFWLLLLLPLALLLTGAVTPNSSVSPQTPNNGLVQFLQGTDAAGTYKTLYTGGANGSKCFGLTMTTSDTTATHVVTVQIVRGGVRYGGTTATTGLGNGFVSSLQPINLAGPATWPGLPLDSDSNEFFYLTSSDSVQATYATALTAGAVINLIATCADF